MFTSAQQLEITRTELDAVFFQRFDQLNATEFSVAQATTAELFKPIETTHSAYIEEVYKGIGLYQNIGETTVVPLQTPAVRNKVTTLVGDYANSVELSKNLFDDNLHGVWAETVSQFAQLARVTQNNNAMALFRNAFTTTLTHDGSALITSSHTLIGGGTASNLISGALDSDSLNLAFQSLAEQKNQAGVIMGNTAKILLVPPKLLKKAVELTDSALIGDTANNAINFYRSSLGLTVMTSPYLGAAAGGSDTAWFVLADNHGIRRLIRQGVQTALRSWEMSNNRSYLYQANFRESYYAIDWAGIVGSLGT